MLGTTTLHNGMILFTLSTSSHDFTFSFQKGRPQMYLLTYKSTIIHLISQCGTSSPPVNKMLEILMESPLLMGFFFQVRDLLEASKKHETLLTILDHDIANDTVKAPGSNSRNLRRVRQGLDLVRALFEQFMSTE